MSERTSVEHFQHEIEAVITRFSLEYSMTNAEAVGVLEMVKSDLIESTRDDDELDNYDTDGAP